MLKKSPKKKFFSFFRHVGGQESLIRMLLGIDVLQVILSAGRTYSNNGMNYYNFYSLIALNLSINM